MTMGMLGLLLGAVAGIASFLALQLVRSRVAMAESKKLLQVVSVLDLVAFPVIGYLIGAYVLE